MPDGRGGLARFCQQCTRLEPLSFFDGQRRSCRSSLAKRQERMSAARRRNHSGSDEQLSSSNSDGPQRGEEEAGGTGTRRAALLAAAGAGSPRSSVSQLRHKRSRSTSPPLAAAGPGAARLALPQARPLAATFPSPAALLQPRASGEHDDSSAATAQLGLLLPSVLAGLLGAQPAGGSMTVASAMPASTTALTSTNHNSENAATFLASLAAASGCSKVPLPNGTAGSTLAAVAAAVAAAAAPPLDSTGLGPPALPLPSNPHELRQMLSTLLQLQALVSSVIIPQVQQRLAAIELAAVLAALGPEGISAAAQPLLSLVQQPMTMPPAQGLPEQSAHGAAMPGLPAAAQEAAVAQLLGSLASQQQEEQQRRQQHAQQAAQPQPLQQHAQQPVPPQQQQAEQREQGRQLQPQASVQQAHAELPAIQLAAVIQQLLGQ